MSVRWVTLILFLVGSLAGCGDKGPVRIPVTGLVYSSSIPENLNGSIAVLPEGDTKGPAANGLIRSGTYEFTVENGPVPGRHRVLIDVEPPRGKMDEAAESTQQQWKFEFHVSVPAEPPYTLDFDLVREEFDE
ncbi:MAG: hypothetical protein RIK87_19700 [Fuerstiella sp.]